jgi:PAS domain S-box-containing protein
MHSNPENVPLVRGRLVRDPAELAAWREELLAATGRAAERMLNGQLDAQAFQAALGILGQAAHVDRVYVFAIHDGVDGELACSQTYEWCAAGVEPQVDNPDLHNMPLLAGGFGRWIEELSADRPVYGDVSDFPVAERKVLDPQGIRSLAVMPVLRHAKLWGFIGFDDCTHHHKWTSDTIGCLHVAARVLSAALERLDYKHRSESLEADYRNLVESLDNIVFRLSQDGKWSFLSPAWETQLGWTLPASLGRPAIRFVHPTDRRSVVANWRRLRQDQSVPFRSEVRVLRPDGILRWMLVNARVQAGPDGSGGVMTGTLTDISASKQIEADLIAARIAAESANKAKSDFLSTMSHELRTPLNAVIGLSESLIEMGASFEADRTKRYLGIIHNSGRQLLAQIDDILELARIEAGRTQLNPVPFDLTSLLSSLAEWAQREARATSQQIIFQRPAEAVVVNADERLLRQMLQNLVSNAMKFTPPNGQVELRVERRPEEIGRAHV